MGGSSATASRGPLSPRPTNCRTFRGQPYDYEGPQVADLQTCERNIISYVRYGILTGMKRPVISEGACSWIRWRGGYAIVGPSEIVQPGKTVSVWNKRRRDYTKVIIKSTLGQGGDGQTIGFPQKASAGKRDYGAQTITLEQWRSSSSNR